MQLFFEPRSVVLIGTSRQTGPGAYNNLEMLLSYGYPGRIFLVHPKVPDIMGYKTYPRVADLPEVPDLAVISQGFADADARGAELQADLVRLAREHGVRVLGPNTMGVLNPYSGFTTAFIDVQRDPRPHIPRPRLLHRDRPCPCRLRPGPPARGPREIAHAAILSSIVFGRTSA
jgi:acetyltransferase